MNHTCHATLCRVSVPPEKLMCLAHWRVVPRSIQKQVWAHYRDGQCDDKRPSKQWIDAADAAIGFVAMREDVLLRVSEVRALLRRGYRQSLIRAVTRRKGEEWKPYTVDWLNSLGEKEPDTTIDLERRKVKRGEKFAREP